jgi:fumarylacetoacetase
VRGHSSGLSDPELPLGVFSRPGEAPRGGIAIGDKIVHLSAAHAASLFARMGIAPKAAIRER